MSDEPQPIPIALGDATHAATPLARWSAIGKRVATWQPSGLVGEVGLTLSTRFGITGVQVVLGVLITRILGPHDRGDAAVAAAAGAVAVQFGNLGLHSAHAYYAAKEPRLLPTLAANSLLVSGLVGALCGAGLVLVCLLTPWLPLHPVFAILVAVPIPFQLAQLMLQQLMVANGQVRAFNALEILSTVVSQCLLVLMLLCHATSVAAMLWVGILTTAITFAATWRCLKPNVPGPYRVDLKLMRRVIPYGLKVYVACLFAFLVVKFDILMLDALRGPAATGIYSVAASLCDLLLVFPMVVGSMLFPRLTAIRDPREQWSLAWRTFVVVAALLSVGGAVLWLFDDVIVLLLVGPRFAEAARALDWLIPGAVMLAANTIFMSYFASRGLPWIAVYAPACACLLNIGLNYLWIPVAGGTGAAMSSCVAYALMLACSAAYLLLQRPWRLNRCL